MSVAARLAIVPLLVVSALHAATPKPELFPADPLSTTPDGGPRVPPSGLTAAGSAAPLDWAQRIDQAWGPSPWTIPQMLSLFDAFWNKIDQSFACFQGLTVDWTALRTTYRAEVSAGVSRGRFAAIMNHLALALRESHTTIWDPGVNFSALSPGVPLFVVGGWGNNQRFGAGLTPLPDGSLLVYQAMPNHPLGLVPGDIVLGYGGVPWKDIYPDLLAAQLPLTGFWWGSSDSSWAHSMLMSAGLNWHLFDTIDVVKHDTGQTVHLSVTPLSGIPAGVLDCTEQLPIPGVPKPDYLGSNDTVSWGIVEGTSVGYVYVRAWTADADAQFYSAVEALLMQYDTSGLIFDFRTNYGGNMFLSYPALSLLFSQQVFTIDFGQRCGNPADHLAMCALGIGSNYAINGAAAADYDRPIAVLVGPGAVSSGDQVANLFSFHPQARFFGKSTSTAFNSPTSLTLPLAGWSSRYAQADAYRLSDPGNYLTHDELHVDEPVWLTPDDVALGRDTVVEAARQWILNETPTCSNDNACDDGNPCTVNDACSSGVCVGQALTPAEVDNSLRVMRDGTSVMITWDPAPGNTAYDVLRGSISGLPVGPGGGDEVCLASGMSGTSATDSVSSSPAAAWYLVRSSNICGSRSYGSQRIQGIETPRTTTGCP